MLPLARIKKYRLRQMKKFFLLFFAGIISAATLQARITAFGESPKYGIKPLPESAEFYDVNPHTWDVFTTFDGDEIIGANQPRRTVFQIEAYSASVMEGRRVGEFTPVASLTDRGAFFGGDGYMDLYYSAPVDSKYAQQAVFFGGWKYNLTKYVDIDLGGNIIYTTKKVAGPGLVGLGGENWRGDIYAGFTSDKIFLCPFVYVGYDPTYDSLKFQGGFNPVISLEELTAIKGLSIQSQIIFGYVHANRFSGEARLSNGNYWRNSYGYIQAESNLVYERKSWRFFVGVGWACNNDGEIGPDNVNMGPDNFVWTGGGVGYIF